MATEEECRKALERLLARISDLDAADRATHLGDRTLSCRIPDLGVTFVTRLRPDGADPVREAGDGVKPAQIRFTANSDVVVSISDDPASFARAWLTGRLKVQGNVFDLLRLRKLMLRAFAPHLARDGPDAHRPGCRHRPARANCWCDAGRMPEGDTVWRTARRLDEALAGQVLTCSDFRVPRFATTDLTGRAVTETVSRGKHLLTRVDGGLTVHTHLRMDGSWRIRPADGYLPRDHRIRLVLGNASRQALGYQLGVVEVLPTRSEARAVGHLGPDLLGTDWDAAEAVRRLRADPDRPVGDALLDQRNLAGIGNLYKSEVLFLRGLGPWRTVGSIGDPEALVELARKLLDANKGRAGQITTGNPDRGQETWVYGRPGRPCRRCGTAIRTARAVGGRADPGDRVTFWCPHCQP